MARPRAKDLTEREVEVMHTFWDHGEQTAGQVRDRLAAIGLDRAYATIANLVRILHEKGFLEQTNADRPFTYRPAQSYEAVSGRLLNDVIRWLFRGSRAELLVRLVERRKLSAAERALLQSILKEEKP
jgi:predicted transcriptional regulator